METKDIRQDLESLFSGAVLQKEDAQKVLTAIARGMVDDYQIASFLTCFRMRPITAQEVAGFRAAMIDLAIPVDFSDFATIDLCGTGGDGKDTFNISTTASFVVAGAGYKVAKHGNYGVSSSCGSSNVLEYLGYQMTNDTDRLRRDLEQANFCYMHAPLFHPAMKEVGPVRKRLGVKTFFNILGPLLNPSRPRHQITGVYHTDLIPLYQGVFEDVGTQYAVVRSTDGYDEVSLTGRFALATKRFTGELGPDAFDLAPVDPSELAGGETVAEAARILQDVVTGQGTGAQENVVCANAALAIQRFQPESSLVDCLATARESIKSGQAADCLRKVTGG